MSEREAVELPNDAVEAVLKELETAQRQGEISLSHDEVRPSVHMMALACRDAYRELVEAHPDYELTTPDADAAPSGGGGDG